MRAALIGGAALALVSGSATADDSPLLFMDHSVTVLHGTGFEVPGNSITTFTFEHVSVWSWGDVFGFFDYLDYHDNPNLGHGWYGEFSPRFSLNKLGLVDLSADSVIADLSISTTYERGRGGTEGLLLGLGMDFKVPGFKFFKTNLYARKDTGLGAGFEDMQFTLAWNRPFTIGEESFVIDGFMDYVVGWGPQASAVHLVPQIKWDLGAKFGRPGKLYFGTEIDIWHNQFGIKDTPTFNTNQIAINAILKAHF